METNIYPKRSKVTIFSISRSKELPDIINFQILECLVAVAISFIGEPLGMLW